MLWARKQSDVNVAPNPARRSDFELFRRDIPADGPRDDDRIGANIVAKYPPGLADNDNPLNLNLAFERSLDPDPAASAQVSAPINPRA